MNTGTMSRRYHLVRSWKWLARRSSGPELQNLSGCAARVESVLGEFYWKVETGEAAWRRLCCAALHALEEVSTSYVADANEPEKKRSTGEINWSSGTYVTPQQIEKSFGVSALARPSGTALKTNLTVTRWIYKYWIILILPRCW